MDPDHRTLQGGLVHQYAAAGFIENRKGDSATSKALEYAVDYFGDTRNELSSKWAPVVKQAYERHPDAVGSVSADDLVNNSGNVSEWRDWFGALRPAPPGLGSGGAGSGSRSGARSGHGEHGPGAGLHGLGRTGDRGPFPPAVPPTRVFAVSPLTRPGRQWCR